MVSFKFIATIASKLLLLENARRYPILNSAHVYVFPYLHS